MFHLLVFWRPHQFDSRVIQVEKSERSQHMGLTLLVLKSTLRSVHRGAVVQPRHEIPPDPLVHWHLCNQVCHIKWRTSQSFTCSVRIEWLFDSQSSRLVVSSSLKWTELSSLSHPHRQLHSAVPSIPLRCVLPPPRRCLLSHRSHWHPCLHPSQGSQ